MFPVTSLSNQLSFCTVRIETRSKTSKGFGTGFFFSKPSQDGNMPILVTNKHVVKDADSVYFHLGLCKEDADEPSGEHIRIEIPDASALWIDHPDPDVDLCAVPFGPIYHMARRKGRNVFHRNIDIAMIPTDEDLAKLFAVEEVLMFGYPHGIWDHKHNLPIVRRGITATHPCMDFQGLPICLVDMACWPGSSGSPVLIAEEGSYRTPEGLVMGSRVLFVGVLFAGPVCTTDGEIVMRPIPTYQDEVTVNQIPINLGYLVKAREVLTLQETIMERMSRKIEAANVQQE